MALLAEKGAKNALSVVLRVKGKVRCTCCFALKRKSTQVLVESPLIEHYETRLAPNGNIGNRTEEIHVQYRSCPCAPTSAPDASWRTARARSQCESGVHNACSSLTCLLDHPAHLLLVFYTVEVVLVVVVVVVVVVAWAIASDSAW